MKSLLMASTKSGPIGPKDNDWDWLTYIVNNIVGCISAEFGPMKWTNDKVGTYFVSGK